MASPPFSMLASHATSSCRLHLWRPGHGLLPAASMSIGQARSQKREMPAWFDQLLDQHWDEPFPCHCLHIILAGVHPDDWWKMDVLCKNQHGSSTSGLRRLFWHELLNDSQVEKDGQNEVSQQNVASFREMVLNTLPWRASQDTSATTSEKDGQEDFTAKERKERDDTDNVTTQPEGKSCPKCGRMILLGAGRFRQHVFACGKAENAFEDDSADEKALVIADENLGDNTEAEGDNDEMPPERESNASNMNIGGDFYCFYCGLDGLDTRALLRAHVFRHFREDVRKKYFPGGDQTTCPIGCGYASKAEKAEHALMHVA